MAQNRSWIGLVAQHIRRQYTMLNCTVQAITVKSEAACKVLQVSAGSCVITTAAIV